MMKVFAVCLAGVICGGQVHAHAAHGKRHDVIKVTQENGCKMSPGVTKVTLATLKIASDDAVTMIGNLSADDIVAFDTDNKTLLLLPTECKV